MTKVALFTSTANMRIRPALYRGSTAVTDRATTVIEPDHEKRRHEMPSPAPPTNRPSRAWLRHLAVTSIGGVALVWLVSDGGTGVTTRLRFTGAAQVYTVPANVCRIRIVAVGAAGGPAGTTGSPGAGVRAAATFLVQPGELLRVFVGGWGGAAGEARPGAGGWNGGGDGGQARGYPDGRAGRAGSGGGGATDVRRGGDGLERRILVAAGGAGAAGGGIGGALGTGGGGGGLVGQAGYAPLGTANPATGGAGGTAVSGGEAGRDSTGGATSATPGTLGAGGSGGDGAASGGGGGGGGLFGGGGGGSGDTFSGGHGGGGSSFGPPGTDFRPGAGAGDGWATISYDTKSDTCDRVRGA